MYSGTDLVVLSLLASPTHLSILSCSHRTQGFVYVNVILDHVAEKYSKLHFFPYLQSNPLVGEASCPMCTTFVANPDAGMVSHL